MNNKMFRIIIPMVFINGFITYMIWTNGFIERLELSGIDFPLAFMLGCLLFMIIKKALEFNPKDGFFYGLNEIKQKLKEKEVDEVRQKYLDRINLKEADKILDFLNKPHGNCNMRQVLEFQTQIYSPRNIDIIE